MAKHLLGGFNVLSLETLESSLLDVDMGDEGVQLVGGVLILVTHAGKTDTHPEKWRIYQIMSIT